MIINLTRKNGDAVMVASGSIAMIEAISDGSRLKIGGEELEVKESPARVREMVNTQAVKI